MATDRAAARNDRRCTGASRSIAARRGASSAWSGCRRSPRAGTCATLICDATGDAELLRAIWPQLETTRAARLAAAAAPAERADVSVRRPLDHQMGGGGRGQKRERDGAEDRGRAAAVRGGADEGAGVRRRRRRRHHLQVDAGRGSSRTASCRTGSSSMHLRRPHRHERAAERAGAVRDRPAAGVSRRT